MRIGRVTLAEAASVCARMAASRINDIWAEVRLAAEGGKLTLTAMDSANRIHLSVECEGDLEPICVHAGRFSEVVNSLLAEEVAIDVDGSRLLIVGGRGKRHLATRSASDYPEIEFKPETEVEILGAKLKDALSFTLPHIAPADDPSKRNMSGVHLVSKAGKLRAIGTDAHEIAVCDVGECPRDFSVSLNPKVAEFAAKLMCGGNVTLRLSLYRTEIDWGYGVLSGVTLGEDFPLKAVEHALAKDYDRSAQTEANTFLQALQSIRPIGEMDSLSRSKRVKLTLNGCGVVSTQSGEGSAEQEFPVDWPGDEKVTGFASARMDRILRHFGDAVLSIGIRDDESAMKIEAAGQLDRLCLLFPLRV